MQTVTMTEKDDFVIEVKAEGFNSTVFLKLSMISDQLYADLYEGKHGLDNQDSQGASIAHFYKED